MEFKKLPVLDKNKHMDFPHFPDRFHAAVFRLWETCGKDKLARALSVSPDVTKVKDITKEDLKELKIGYRDEYIIDAIKKVSSGEISYEELVKLPYKEAKEKLLTVKGIGNKVADCILLFSLLKFEAFPVDTWIKKAMAELYNLKEKEIKDYSKINFGDYSGFAQQYIFYYIRSSKYLK